MAVQLVAMATGARAARCRDGARAQRSHEVQSQLCRED